MYRVPNNLFMSMETRCPIWHSTAGWMLDFAELDGTNNMGEVRNAGLCVAKELRNVC